jgi:hypothetical protein
MPAEHRKGVRLTRFAVRTRQVRRNPLQSMFSRTHIQDLLLSRNETAATLIVSRQTLRRWHKSGFLIPLMAGGLPAAYLKTDVEKTKEAIWFHIKPVRRPKKALNANG